MKKKIIDIIPPQERQTTEKVIEKQIPKKTFFKKKRSKYFLTAILSLFVLLFLIWLASPLYSTLSLEIRPIVETRIFEQDIEVNIAQSSLDIQNKIIPGRFFEKQEEKQKTFETTGQKIIEEKAEGIIRVYNEHNPPRPVTLRATTRFLSSEGGKIFRCPEKIYLAAARIVNNKIVPSFKDVKVVAQEGGEDYNIGASKFSVPGLVGSSLYYSVWAESEQGMEGGFRQEAQMITKENIEMAQDELRQELIELVQESLQSELPEGFLLNKDSLLIRSFQSSCSGEEGGMLPEFACNANISIKGLAFSLSNIKEIVIDSIKQEILSGKNFNSQGLTIESFSKNLVSESGKMILNVKATTDLYDRIPQEFIISQIKGKSEQEIQQIFVKNYPQIKEIKVNLKPFWVKKSPKNPEKIKFQLTF